MISELFMLAEAIPAIDRPVCLGLEWHFAFISAISTNCLMHLSVFLVSPETASSVLHRISLSLPGTRIVPALLPYIFPLFINIVHKISDFDV